MFRHDPKEIDLWLEALPRNYLSKSVSLSDNQTEILQFLDDCIVRFGKAQYRYIDQLVQLVDKTNAERLASHATPATKQLLQNLLGSDGTSIGSSDYTHPFSPLLLTLVERLKFVKANKRVIVHFITRVLVLLLRKQKNPFYLQHACATMDVDVGTTSSACDVGDWSESEMIQQATMCLDLTVEPSMELDVEPHSGSRPDLEAILTRMCLVSA